MVGSDHTLLYGLAEFVVSYVLIMALPGANVLVVANASAAGTRTTALAAAAGIGCGAAILALAALTGASVFSADPRAVTLGKLLLAAILVAISLKALRRACLAPAAVRSARSARCGGHFCLGLLTAVTNPVTSAFFLGSTIQAGLSAMPFGAGAFAALVFVVATGWFGTVALLLSSPGVRARYDAWRRPMDIGAGIALAGLGTVMALRLIPN